MRHMSVIAIAALVSALSACTFVHMAPGATKVKVLASAPTSCTKRGEVEVSVKDRLGPYERSESQVRDELETLARNEAPGVGARCELLVQLMQFFGKRSGGDDDENRVTLQ